jgi:hypothetical protein
MRRALTQQGVKLASDARGAYSVQGQVEMGPAADGKQAITIRWIVTDPSGKQLQRVVLQKNKVAEGQLDKAWGEVADRAAEKAAEEVAKLIGKPSGQAQQGNAAQAG